MTMKVCYVINGLGTGGAERSLAEMLPVLRDAGVTMTIVCLHRRAQGVEAATLQAGFDVRFFVATTLAGRVTELRRILRSERPDIVHTTIFDSDLIGRLAAIGQRCRVVTSLVNTSYEPERLRDPNVSRVKLRAASVVDGWTARHLTDRFHAITEAVRDSAIRCLGLDPTRISVVERGRDAHRLGRRTPQRRAAARRKLGLTDDDLVIVNVGRQEFQKGHRDLLGAVRTLAKDRPGVVLLQAGRCGHATPMIEASLGTGGLQRHVRLLGHVDDVPELLAAGDVFAFPSIYEGLGGAVIEAMALSLPIVTTRVPALLEVVEENCNALTVPVGDPRALAAAIAALLDDDAKRHEFGVRSREIFERKFTLEHSVERMLRFYRSTLAA
jgi:glycosyltransferase involved in cell wall biosynthesis